MNRLDLMRVFPRDRYPSPTGNQLEALGFLETSENSSNIIEAPTGTGKTAVGYTWLQVQSETDQSGHRFYLVPNKTLVDQVVRLHPDMQPMYGRNEHPCLYYGEEGLRADQIPCTLLTECPHRVNQETGCTHDAGAVPCPYLKQKYEARKSNNMIVATHAFYLYAAFFGKQFEPAAVVVDEAHGIAKSIRSVLEFRITDWKLDRIVRALDQIGSAQAPLFRVFQATMIRLATKREPGKKDRRSILMHDEIRTLLDLLEEIDVVSLRGDITVAVAQGVLDPHADRESLKQLEVISRDLKRYINSFRYSLPPDIDEATRRRHPLNYTFAFWVKEKKEKGRVQYELVVKSYNVAGLIRTMLPERVLAYSATIADPDIFSFENGVQGDFCALGSDFPTDHTRVFMPTDTPNLAVKARRARDKAKATRLVIRAAKQFADNNIRSLIVVVSNEERERVLKFAKEEGLDAISYGNGVSPREAALAFRDNGKGMALVGTVANYGEGVDLPNQTAPVIFCLRPAYPHPEDPQTVFEEGRFGNHRWNLWNWRIMVEMLQVRGRNVRSATDRGVTFLISQQFRRFARASLPSWVRPSYVGDKTMEECITEALVVLDSNTVRS